MILTDLFGNPGGNKALVAAAFSNIPLTFKRITRKKLNDEEFLKKSPLGQVPLLETTQGAIYKSRAILRHIGRVNKNARLLGSSDFEQTLVDQWLEFDSSELEPAVLVLLNPIFGWQPALTEEVSAKANSDLQKTLKILDGHLLLNTFLVGTQVTIADISLAGTLIPAYQFYLEAAQRESFPNLLRWLDTLLHLNPFKKVYGIVRFAVNRFPTAEIKVAESKPAAQDQKRPQKGKEGQKQTGGQANKEAQQKKESQVKKEAQPKPSKKENEAEEEDEAALEKKKKHPLELLPPTNFNLYDYKTLYINAVNKREALDTLWNTFDAQGFSIWYTRFNKDDDEGKKLFMTNNLLRGVLARLDSLRKYCLGVIGVYGEEPDLEIRGCWLWRGLGKPEEINEWLSNFQVDKLDHTNEAQRKRFEEYWLNVQEGDVVEGLKAKTIELF